MTNDHRKEILNYVTSSPRFNGENSAFIDSVNRLPNFDYSRFYGRNIHTTNLLEQGDVMPELPIVNLPQEGVKNSLALIVSSTCDMDPRNERQTPMNIVYAPIMRLSVYVQLLKDNGKYSLSHIQDIKKQNIGRFFYLPQGSNLDDEYIAMLDKLCNASSKVFEGVMLDEVRTVRLSDYGWYILLEKLSLFFTRATDDTIALRFQ